MERIVKGVKHRVTEFTNTCSLNLELIFYTTILFEIFVLDRTEQGEPYLKVLNTKGFNQIFSYNLMIYIK